MQHAETLSRGASPNSKNKKGGTALSLAKKNGRTDIVPASTTHVPLSSPLLAAAFLGCAGAVFARGYKAHFFFSSAVQLVITFKGRELVSGAALPIKRWPSFGSTSKIVCTRPVRNGDRIRYMANGRHGTVLVTHGKTKKIWWTWSGSNRRPPACKARNSPPTIPLETFKH